mgnify:CR=1 FL=1|jgi:hypothetical protein
MRSKVVEAAKKLYTELFNDVIIKDYPNAKNLFEYIKQSTFFTDPASIKYHSSYEGGLCVHSVFVKDRLSDLIEHNLNNFATKNITYEYKESDVAIAALCHDLCKIGTYKIATRNVKVKSPSGVTNWQEEQFYTYNEPEFVYGHGEKSAFLISKFVEVPDFVLQAVRYHMGGIETFGHDPNASKAYAQNPLALLLHIADLQATYLDEVE